MPCPTCGGNQYTLVGPGVAQCDGRISVPTGLHPSGAMGPTAKQFVCGTQYQVANPASSGYCDCGMQSVSACTHCRKLLCLSHTYRVDGRVVCQSEATRFADEQQHASNVLTDSIERRFRDALDGLSPNEIRGGPDKVIEHRMAAGYSSSKGGDFAGDMSQEELDSAKVGDACKKHGGTCRITTVSAYGRFKKRVSSVTCQMPVWVVSGVPINAAGSFVGNVPDHSNFAPNMFVTTDLTPWLAGGSRSRTALMDSMVEEIRQRQGA